MLFAIRLNSCTPFQHNTNSFFYQCLVGRLEFICSLKKQIVDNLFICLVCILFAPEADTHTNMIVMKINKNRFELALPITTLFIAIFTFFYYCCFYLLSSAGMILHRIQIALMCWIAVVYIYCESWNSKEAKRHAIYDKTQNASGKQLYIQRQRQWRFKP